jgi:hypothetical protein
VERLLLKETEWVKGPPQIWAKKEMVYALDGDGMKCLLRLGGGSMKQLLLLRQERWVHKFPRLHTNNKNPLIT